MAKILFLGGAAVQCSAIHYAMRQGHIAIVCDRDLRVPGFQIADNVHQISISDIDAILAVAKAERIDGVLGYASDVGAFTAACVAEELDLPGNGAECVDTLINKPRFQKLCTRIGINSIDGRSFSESLFKQIGVLVEQWDTSYVIKPAISSGSRGVTILDAKEGWLEAARNALTHSRNGEILVEQLIEHQGRQICGDGFVASGKLVFACFGDGHFHSDRRFMAPFGETFPSEHDPAHLACARKVLEKVVEAAEIKVGCLNFDIVIRKDGSAHIFDLSPRAGGNYIPDAIRVHTGVDLVEASVESSISRDYQLPSPTLQKAHPVASYMIHTLTGGTLAGVDFSPQIEANILRTKMFVPVGAAVDAFTNAPAAIGNVLLQFSDESELHAKFGNIHKLVSPLVH